MQKLVPLKLLLVSALLLINPAFAQAQDAKQQLKTKLAQLKTYQAKFIQQVTDFENTVLQQATGQIMLEQPNKLYWELFEPNESVLLADGRSIWNIDPFLQQVVVYSADSALDNNPLILLTDPNSDRWQEFNVSTTDSQFVITPLTDNGGVEFLRLVFAGNNLIELESRDAQQQTSRLLFSEIKQNQGLPSAQFTFVKPAGFELDDQRTP
jgi:outer membrane lipoprotein carrier protein